MHPAPRDRSGPTGVLRSSGGLTLIEVLVCFILLSLLAAAVFPVVTRRVARGEPDRARDDLAAIATALERFAYDHDGVVPADLDALLAPIDPADGALGRSGQRVPYPEASFAAWDGPYLQLRDGESGLRVTGFGVPIRAELVAFESEANLPADAAGFDSLAAEMYGAVAIGTAGRPLTVGQFEAINDLVDGVDEPDGLGPAGSWKSGRLRLSPTDSGSQNVAYFLAAPLRR